MLLREVNEKREQRDLASYALKSASSRGRVHPERDDRFRTIYLRDRDRIIHSSAFRRLEFKTQVFIHNEGDYYRTRLTHTLEVAQIARSVAYTLRFNEGFVEALALAHDLGHPPFGHTGEGVLADLMEKVGGFEHNRQALRIVDTLEKKYPSFEGLNLSHEVREAILKYGPGEENIHTEMFRTDLKPWLEARIVNLSDRIAYQHHDLDDGLKADILKEKDLSEVDLWRGAEEDVKRRFPRIGGRIRRLQVVNAIAKILIGDLIENSHRALKEYDGMDAAAMREIEREVIAFSPNLQTRMDSLQDFLNDRFYGHPRLAGARKHSEEILRDFFHVYLKKPRILPEDFRNRIDGDGVWRVVCDYVAGMTDRFALDEWNRLDERAKTR